MPSGPKAHVGGGAPGRRKSASAGIAGLREEERARRNCCSLSAFAGCLPRNTAQRRAFQTQIGQITVAQHRKFSKRRAEKATACKTCVNLIEDGGNPATQNALGLIGNIADVGHSRAFLV